MTRLASILTCAFGIFAASFTVRGEEVQKVHVVVQTQCGDTIERLSDTIHDTGTSYTLVQPPVRAGFTFGYWKGYPTSEDRIEGPFWTYPATPTITVYGEMTLTAFYTQDGLDSDGNGITDRDEVYWHVEGVPTSSDLDGDGYTLIDEIRNGTNPWCKDVPQGAGIAYADSGLIVYNPHDLPTCVIRSEPEGALMDTVVNTCVTVGTTITTPTMDPRTSSFAYWSVNGVRQTDAHGVALRSVSFNMPNADVLVIAETEEDALKRQQLFYYGMSFEEDYDTDGDGYTFTQEVGQGTNPHFPDEGAEAGISYADSGLIDYNPNNLRDYVVRSEPEGALFDTQVGTYVAPGTVVTTPVCDPTTSTFAYWSLNGVRQCDAYGVALKQVTTSVGAEDVELVAVTERDAAVRLQYYWYGERLEEDVDTDGDGYRFSQEVAQGTSPHFADVPIEAGISYADSGLIDYNPNNLHDYVIRSEPEGVLFDTKSAAFVAAGTVVTTPVCDPTTSAFAYWTLNGVRQCDAYGVAVTSVRATMGSEDVELVAVTIGNAAERSAYYWYGEPHSQSEDTDGDGYDLAAEDAQGTNPRFVDRPENNGITYADSALVEYNPRNLHSYVMRSEPEGVLFDTIESGLLEAGTAIATPVCDPEQTVFAYWEVNGVRQCDAYGVAKTSLALTMGGEDLDIVAVTHTDEATRKAWYWYGSDIIPVEDSDRDGFVFADELTQGTSPVFSNATISAGIAYADSGLIDYNPLAKPTCITRSEPEGVLFATIVRRELDPGQRVETPTGVANQETFACWKKNGVVQRDIHGRAMHDLSFEMPNEDVELVAVSCEDSLKRARLYWYGSEKELPVDDTDGDGMGLKEEVDAGTSPIYPNDTEVGGIGFADTVTFEVNLQPYEQPTGVLVGERYVDFFSSPMAGKDGRIFAGGAAIWPVVGDVDLDGLWDLVVVSAGETNLFLNVGSQGNPKFVEEDGAEVGYFIDLMMNSTEKLDFMTLDVPPIAALSATTNGATMLVSDTEGRIWYYVRGAEDVAPYQLQHKVWGGSFDGFAKGLKLAAVDWEDDGDLDCICGTAEGKLILLKDPKAGRPTGLEALAGVDNVKLDWDPNEQPRVKGYKVYRGEGEGEGEQWSAIGLTSLPTYRDWPGVIQDYQYRVTSLSRFYVAGSSTPVENESIPSDAVRAELGKVRFLWTDAAGFVGKEIPVSLGVENSLNLSGEGMKFVVAYNAEKLQPVRVEKSGLTTGVAFTESAEGGVWTLQATGGTIEPGGGTLFTFVFKGLKEAEATPVALTSATLRSVGGADVPAIMPSKDAQVAVEEMKPAYADIVLTDSVVVKSGDSFKVDVSAVGERIDPATLKYEYVYDHDYFSRNGNTFVAADVGEKVVSFITVTNVSVKATDGSEAKIESVGQCAVSLFPQEGEESRHLAHMKIKDVRGETDEIVAVPIGICSGTLFFRDTILDISGWEFEVWYSDVALEYVGYEAEVGAYVCKAEEDVFGHPYVSVRGKSGTLNLGRAYNLWKYPIKLLFKIKKQYAFHSAILDFGYVTARATDGWHILTPVRLPGEVHIHFVWDEKDPTVVVPYARGDVNGDGVLSKEDEQLLARLMNGGKKEKWTADELRAGDYNGNGKLDQGDYHLMKEDFKGKGIK